MKRNPVMDTDSAIGNVTPTHASSDRQSSEEVDRALLTSISSAGDRCAIEKLYASYFWKLAKFFLNLNVQADFIEELIVDTMIDVWKGGASIGANVSVSVAIMRIAYSHGQRYFTKATETQRAVPHDRRNDDRSLPVTLAVTSNQRDARFTFSFEERALLHLVYGCGHSRQETADIMNVSNECVDLLLGSARCRHRSVDREAREAEQQVHI
jgi:DNA-directed RNA polymerase specialized sigma24 family protein